MARKKTTEKPASEKATAVAEPEVTATSEEELVEPETKLTVVSGIGQEIWKESTFVPALRPDMELSVRKESCRQILLQASKIDDRLNLVAGEVLFEVNQNAYWSEYTMVDPESGEERAFASFEEYADLELGMKRRKAYYLMGIYKKFVVELELDREHLQDLEWSKVKYITKHVTKENVLDILDTIKGMSKKQVEEYAKTLGGKGSEEGGPAESTTSAASEEFETIKFKVSPPQGENIRTALKIAESLSGSDKAGNQLDMICSDFIAGSSGQGLEGALGNLQNSMRSLERAYGVKLVMEEIVDESRYASMQTEEPEEATAE